MVECACVRHHVTHIDLKIPLLIKLCLGDFTDNASVDPLLNVGLFDIPAVEVGLVHVSQDRVIVVPVQCDVDADYFRLQRLHT